MKEEEWDTAVSAFLRVYGARDRARLKPHFDAFAAATAVVDLAPDAHSGHYFVQSGPHVSSRRRAVFAGRDALVHDAVLLHGVADVDDGTRTSLVFWFHAEADADAADPDVLFASAPRLNMLAVRPSLCWERRGISSTENSSLITEDAKPAKAASRSKAA